MNDDIQGIRKSLDETVPNIFGRVWDFFASYWIYVYFILGIIVFALCIFILCKFKPKVFKIA